MKFFIDSADIEHIKHANSLGLVDGVTTNPSLVAKTGRGFEEVIQDIVKVVDGPISAEVLATDYEGIVSQGRKLAKIHKNIVIKVPLIPDGLQATNTLENEGIPCNVTLCFSPLQALLAAKAGASYISPFIGRLDDVAQVGMDLIEQVVAIYANYGYDTEIIVASIRNPVHVLESAMLGAHIATIPYGEMMKLAKHPLTDIGLANFLKDAQKSGQEV